MAFNLYTESVHQRVLNADEAASEAAGLSPVNGVVTRRCGDIRQVKRSDR